MNILVTGASGFIGKNLVMSLVNSKHNVICAIRKKSNIKELEQYSELKFVTMNFNDIKNLEKACKDIDILIHLAGQLGEYGVAYSEYYSTNSKLTNDLAIIAAGSGVKQFIFCSTPGVLGFGKRLALETEPYNPRNNYEKTKMIAEQLLQNICNKYPQMKYTILRPDFVYGPGDTRRVKMYNAIKNRKFILTTSGDSYLHPTYINDVVQGFICCIGNKNAYNQIFNIAAENDITSKQYLDIIAKYTGTRLIQINIGKRLSHFFAGLIDYLYRILLKKEGFVSKNRIDFLAVDHSSNIEKAKKMIGYIPQYSCEEGIELSIKWCIENKLM